MKRFLVSTDFSVASRKAYQFAIKMANESQGKLTAAYIYSEASLPELPPEMYRAFREKEQEKAEKLLKRFSHLYPNKEKETIHLNCTLEEATSTGEVVSELLDISAKIQADAIVLGIKSVMPKYKAYFSGIAGRIIKKAKIPVFAIPQSYDGHKISKISFAYNVLEEKAGVIQSIEKVASFFGADLETFFVVSHLDQLEEMRAKISNIQPEPTEIYADNTISGIQEYLEKRTTNLLAFSVQDKDSHPLLDQPKFRKYYSKSSIPFLFIPS